MHVGAEAPTCLHKMQLKSEVVSQLRAVLTGALTLSDGTVYNTATELNDFVYNTIAGWCAPCGSTQRSAHAPFHELFRRARHQPCTSFMCS